MTRRLLVLAGAAALLCTTAHAQAPATVPAKPASVQTLQATSPAPAPLTAVEQKDIEILTLKAQLASAYKKIADIASDVGQCHAALGPLQFEQNRQALTQEQTAIKDAIEKARPGYTWNPDTGAFTKKPDPPVADRK